MGGVVFLILCRILLCNIEFSMKESSECFFSYNIIIFFFL